MGKKKSQTKNPGKQSLGLHSTADRKLLNAVRRSRTTLEKTLFKLKAWKKARTDPWITIANPVTSDTKQRFIKVRASVLWGDPKRRNRVVKETSDE